MEWRAVEQVFTGPKDVNNGQCSFLEKEYHELQTIPFEVERNEVSVDCSRLLYMGSRQELFAHHIFHCGHTHS